MALTPWTSSQSGNRTTVNDWVKDPLRVQAYMLNWAAQGNFLIDAVLRDAGQNDSGVVRFEESTPLYADNTVPIRAEGAEVPVAETSAGAPNVAYSVEMALRLLITDEMLRRNLVGKWDVSLTQVQNSLVRAFDQRFITETLANAGIQSQAASAVWSTGSTDIRGDILKAAEKIEGAQDGQGAELGYRADTLIVNRVTKFDVITSTQFNAVYDGGNIASENLLYTGKLPKRILDYDVLESQYVPAGVAILCQRKACGFKSDEVPFTTLPMDEDRNRLSWSSIVRRSAAIGIDQPKAICKLTGVSA